MKFLKIVFILLTIICVVLASCTSEGKEGVTRENNLEAKFTYWAESGPFTGMCGDEYSAVFIAKVDTIFEATQLNEETNTFKQKGVLKIEEFLKFKAINGKEQAKLKYFTSDAFYNSKLKSGNLVLVFCHEYEGDYSIAGHRSLIKLTSMNGAIVKSTRLYINSDQNALVIKKDRNLWRNFGYGESFQRIIECKESMK